MCVCVCCVCLVYKTFQSIAVTISIISFTLAIPIYVVYAVHDEYYPLDGLDILVSLLFKEKVKIHLTKTKCTHSTVAQVCAWSLCLVHHHAYNDTQLHSQTWWTHRLKASGICGGSFLAISNCSRLDQLLCVLFDRHYNELRSVYAFRHSDVAFASKKNNNNNNWHDGLWLDAMSERMHIFAGRFIVYKRLRRKQKKQLAHTHINAHANDK